MSQPSARPGRSPWPLIFIGRVRPRGRHGQRCRRVRRGDDGLTLVRFQLDGREVYVLDRLLVKAEDY
jgi:hypothetical protein